MAARHRRKRAEERNAIVDCGECGKPAGLVFGDVIYPRRRDLHAKPLWRCVCGAFVGCHEGTYRPLGTPCGPETREARKRAHAAFDPLWKAKVDRGVPRKDAREAGYRWLAEQLGISIRECHMGLMNRETALRAAAICEPYTARLNSAGRPIDNMADHRYHTLANARLRTACEEGAPPPWD